MNNIKVGVVDDHQLFRRSLIRVINDFEGIEVTLEAGNGKELLQLLKHKHPDVLLLDIQMPEMDGYQTCTYIQENYPGIKILIISQLSTKESLHRVINIGANGYFSKNSDVDSLKKAIEDTESKDFYFSEDLRHVLQEAVMLESKRQINNNIAASISTRELEIIKLASQEMNSQEIALQLHITPRTVETHRKHIMDKTNCKNFIGVIVFAIKHNLLELQDI